MLGHEVPFSYCRKPGGEQFCRHIVNCWFEQFDIQAYLAEHFTEEQIRAASRPPAPKVESLLSLIERAQKRRDAEREEEAKHGPVSSRPNASAL